MFYNSSVLIPFVYLLLLVLSIVLIVVIAIALIRLMLSATRALDAVTAERKLRLDLLLSDDSES
ncbi:hypothetical protein [Leifsonia sp. A12D58]|uniref:hypothetical protein n=1 Tax=Leifsonia sp. A12D58 TaxID=3397674 RepID=UPI0039E037A4